MVAATVWTIHKCTAVPSKYKPSSDPRNPAPRTAYSETPPPQATKQKKVSTSSRLPQHSVPENLMTLNNSVTMRCRSEKGRFDVPPLRKPPQTKRSVVGHHIKKETSLLSDD